MSQIHIQIDHKSMKTFNIFIAHSGNNLIYNFYIKYHMAKVFNSLLQ